jgi:hypothetical protein
LARALVLIPNPDRLLIGATQIGDGYPRSYTPEQMRTWARDLEHLFRTSRAERDALLRGTREDLSPDAAALRAVYENYFLEPDRGIKGELQADGRVELFGGRHRAAYMVERGTHPVPVWVSCPDPEHLARFRETSHSTIDDRALDIVSDRAPGRSDRDFRERPPDQCQVEGRYEATGTASEDRRSVSQTADRTQLPARTGFRLTEPDSGRTHRRQTNERADNKPASRPERGR